MPPDLKAAAKVKANKFCPRGVAATANAVEVSPSHVQALPIVTASTLHRAKLPQLHLKIVADENIINAAR